MALRQMVLLMVQSLLLALVSARVRYLRSLVQEGDHLMKEVLVQEGVDGVVLEQRWHHLWHCYWPHLLHRHLLRCGLRWRRMISIGYPLNRD